MDELTYRFFMYVNAKLDLILHRLAGTVPVGELDIKRLTDEVNARAAALKAAVDQSSKGEENAAAGN